MAKLRPVASCGAQDVACLWLARVAAEVRSHIAFLGARGWRLWDVAVALDCSPRSIVSWRKGAAEMPATKLERLRALVAEQGSRRAAG
jgi:hypothetical protein